MVTCPTLQSIPPGHLATWPPGHLATLPPYHLDTFPQASTVSPLVTIVIPYPGSYSGPWLNSEHIAAALAAAVFYLAFSSR